MIIGFISDFFSSDIVGGAELNDSVLIDGLEKKGFQVHKIKSNLLKDEDILSFDFMILSNFVNLSERHKKIIMLKKYIIYEHDHKYLKTRNPSVFPNFKFTTDDVINLDLYREAKSVIVLSEICKDLLESNLNLNNVHSIGCSLWSEERLSLIESLLETAKDSEGYILNSSNPIKGTEEAIRYCDSKNISYNLLPKMTETDLLKEVARHKTFIFFPKVLETMSRTVVEAKMLNCNVMTINKLIGASYEEWFHLKGKELIDVMKAKKREAIETFSELIRDETITVILNCYRRPEYLEQQIESIRKQTKKPTEIWIWVNYHEDNMQIDFSTFDVDRVIRNDFNWKFYGRFAGAMLSSSKYIAMFDDDTIPGSKWFDNCLETMKTNEGILGGAGVRLSGDRYVGHSRYGWSSNNESVTEVDLVGHAWFFKREWLKYLWMEQPFTWHNGEDIQFSYCCQKYGDIKTFCPPHPKNQKEMSSSLKGYELGVDDKATSRARNHSVFYAQRDACVKNAILNGWKPLVLR